MSFEISKSYDIMAKALDYRALKGDLISSNIANIDTPNFKARDISFEHALQLEANKLYSSSTNDKLKLAKTNQKDFSSINDNESQKATIFLRGEQNARNDGNTVDLDVETTELAKNTIMYDAIIAALKKDSAIFRSVLDSSAKV
jgi:flagellar basal-body rod protein FlgB